MMVLCVEHHYMVTHGAIDQDDQYSHKANPVNIKNGYTKGLLVAPKNQPVIDAGQTQIIGDELSLSIDGKTVLGLRYNNGQVFITAANYDVKGRKTLSIADNEWLLSSLGRWDVKASYQRLEVHDRVRKEIVLILDMKVYPFKLRCSLKNRKYKLSINKDWLEFRKVDSDQFAFRVVDLCLVAPVLNYDTKTHLMDTRSYYSDTEGPSIIRGDTAEERIEQGLSVLNNIRTTGKSGLSRSSR